MSKPQTRKRGKDARAAAQQQRQRQTRDALRRAIARETEIAHLTRVLVKANARADEALERLRQWLDARAAEEFAARANREAAREPEPAPVS